MKRLYTRIGPLPIGPLPIGLLLLGLLLIVISPSPAQGQQVLNVFGLDHTPRGQATLSVAGSDLILSNIGATGDDGVEILAGESEFLCIELDLADPSIPRAATLWMTNIGELDGKRDTEIGTAQFIRTGTGYHLTVDFPPAPSALQTVLIYQGEEVVAIIGAQEAPSVLISTPQEPVRADPPGGHVYQPGPLEFLFEVPDPTEPVSVQWDEDGLRYTAKATRLVFQSADEVGAVLVTNTIIQAAGMPQVRIVGELLGKFGRAHEARGAARLTALPDQLILNNIGASGDDGVGVVVADEGPFSLRWQAIALRAPGAMISLEATGTLEGKEDASLGEVAFENQAGSVIVNADYSGLGAEKVMLQVYSEDKLVGETTVAAGTVAELTRIDGDGILEGPDGCVHHAYWWCDFQAGVVVLGADGTRFEGDQLHLVPNETGGETGTLHHVSVWATDIDDLVLVPPDPPEPKKVVKVDPENPDPEFPPEGGVLNYTLTIDNNTEETESMDVWIDILHEGGTGFTVGPVIMTVPGNGTLIRMLRQNIPASAPSGLYTLTGLVGTYPDAEATDSFTFVKRPGTSKGGMVTDWAATLEEPDAPAATPEGLPAGYAVSDNYPNPFNPSTTIAYTLPEATHVQLHVYDMTGRWVATLVDARQGAGHHTARFNAHGLASGLYLYRITAGSYVAARRMLLVK